MKLETIINEIGTDVLKENHKKAIFEAFEEAVKVKATELAKLESETAVKKLDEEHAEKLTKLIEAIDADHTNKLKKVLSKVDEDYASKLQGVVEKYETMLKEEAIKFRDQLVSEISNYIELYINDAVPAKQIAEACENVRSKKIVEELKKLVSIDEDYITNNVKEALSDGKNTIETLRAELNEAVKSNIKLSQELKKTSAELVLEKKTMRMPSDKKAYLSRVLGDKSPEYITENFDYVIEMFERDEVEKKEVLTEQAQNGSVARTVDTPKSQISEEPQAPKSRSENLVSEYLNELKGK